MAASDLQQNSDITPARMALLFTVTLVTASGNTAMQSMLPTIGTQLKVPDFWVSLSFSWSALLWSVTAPIWARHADKRGRKKLMHLGLLGFSMSMLFGGFALYFGFHGWYGALATFLLFALFRSLYGLFGSAAPPAVQAYVAARTSKAARTKALSLIASSFGLGTIVGPAIAPLLIIPAIGLASPMFLFFAMAVLVMVALGLRLPNDDPRFAARGAPSNEPYSAGPPLDQPSQSAEDETDIAPAEPSRLRWLDPRIRDWLIVGFLGANVQAIIMGVVGFMILDRLGLRISPAEGIEATAIVLMSGAFATLLAQWGLIPMLQLGPRACTIAGLALGLLGLIVLGQANTLLTIISGFSLTSLGFGLFRPGYTAGASIAVGRQDQNVVAGIITSVNGASYIASPAVGVLLYSFYQPLPFWLALVIVSVLLVWSFATLRNSEGEAD